MRTLFEVAWVEESGVTRKRSRFEDSLQHECRKVYDKLLLQLASRGHDLKKTRMLKHLQGDVWELRGRCDQGALRIYLFSQADKFYLATAEVKKDDKADQRLIAATQRLHDETRRRDE